MKKLFTLILIFMIGFNLTVYAANNGSTIANSQKTNTKKANKILVVYFSHSGNTQEIANLIRLNIGGDIFRILTVKPYPNDYKTLIDQASKEQNDDYRPKLSTKVKNIKPYNVIFLGYPNWWGTMPMAVFTFLEQYNFSGKTIIPFCTHEGSGLGRSIDDIKKLCPKSTVINGMAIRGSEVKDAQTKKDVVKWLKNMGMLKKK